MHNIWKFVEKVLETSQTTQYGSDPDPKRPNFYGQGSATLPETNHTTTQNGNRYQIQFGKEELQIRKKGPDPIESASNVLSPTRKNATSNCFQNAHG